MALAQMQRAAQLGENLRTAQSILNDSVMAAVAHVEGADDAPDRIKNLLPMLKSSLSTAKSLENVLRGVTRLSEELQREPNLVEAI